VGKQAKKQKVKVKNVGGDGGARIKKRLKQKKTHARTEKKKRNTRKGRNTPTKRGNNGSKSPTKRGKKNQELESSNWMTRRKKKTKKKYEVFTEDAKEEPRPEGNFQGL